MLCPLTARIEKIVAAARLYGRAKTAMLMHARGIEHHTNGVNNELSYINIVLATGKIGASASEVKRGYAINFPPLLVIPRYFIYLALAGWIAVSLGLIGTLVRVAPSFKKQVQ